MTIKQKAQRMLPFVILTLNILSYNGTSILSSFSSNSSDPPTIGDWIINDYELRQNEVLNLNGSIIIEENGYLNLSSIDLTFQMKAQGVVNGSFNITVLDGGTLTVESGSKVSTDDPKFLTWINVSENGNILLSDSTFENLGYDLDHPAIQINNAYANISNCLISSSYNLYSTIRMFSTSGIQLLGNTIFSNKGSGIHSQSCQNLVILDNDLQTKDYGIFIDNFQDGRLRIANNRIKSESDNGLSISSSFNGLSSDIPIIEENSIEGAKNKGIYVETFPKVNILSNYVSNIKGSDNNYGSIHIFDSEHAFVLDNFISNSGDDGLVIEQAKDILISFNTIIWSNLSRNTATGINLTTCDDLVVSSNQISSIGGDGIYYSGSSGENISISSNILSGVQNRGIYINGFLKSDIKYNQLSNLQNIGISIQNSSELNVIGNSIDSFQTIAVSLDECIDFNITRNYIRGSRDLGLLVNNSSFAFIQENEFFENLNAVHLNSTFLSTIIGNYFRNNFLYGFFIDNSSQNNSIIRNILYHNNYGIYCEGHNNTFTNHTIQSNNHGALFTINSANNTLYHNDFIDNINQARDFGSFNVWFYNTSPLINSYGNYWSNYDGKDQQEPFGLGDIPYNIIASSADLYPIMKIINNYPPPSISHLKDFIIFDDTTGNTILWSGSTSIKPLKYNIFVNGMLVLTKNWDGSKIRYIVDDLPVGTFYVTCTIYDFLEQTDTDIVKVTVVISPTSPFTTSVDEPTPFLTRIFSELMFILFSLIIALIITGIIAKK
ncbi:MAG: right-handed parallel beta-helix repeat-containing protein [Candidatus Hermodarchaeota archaeon]